MNAKDKERLEELTLRIYGESAIEVLSSDTREVTDVTIDPKLIETHAGRYKKALRMVTEAGIVEYVFLLNSGSMVRVVDFKERAEKYGEKPPESNFIDSIVVSNFGHRYYQKEISQAGYLSGSNRSYSDKISYKEIIYIAFHQDEYSIKMKNDTALVCPKEIVPKVTGLTLRTLVEDKIKNNISRYLNTLIGMPVDIETKNLYPYLRASNHLINNTSILSPNPFKRHKDLGEYLKRTLKAVSSYNQMVEDEITNSKGVEKIRRLAIKEILEKAPLDINNDSNEVKDIAKFVLKNSDYLTYESLYCGDLPPIPEKKEENFVPLSDTIIFIEALEKL